MPPSRFVNVPVLVLAHRMPAARYPAFKIAAQSMSPAPLFGGGARSAAANAGLLAGNVVIFLAGLGSASFNIARKRRLARFGGAPVLLHTCLFALAGCASTSMFIDTTPICTLRGMPAELWFSIAALASMLGGGAMVLSMWALGRLEALQVAAFGRPAEKGFAR